MTTNDIPTPYDKGIEAITYGSNGPTLQQSEQLRTLHNLRDGYLEAKAEDAPLLEAAQQALAGLSQEWQDSQQWDLWAESTRSLLRAAAAIAEGRTP